MKMGPDYRAEHTLTDGTRVLVRHIKPDDADELRRAFARLSPASRYRRFFGGVGALSEETLRYLTDVDGVNHVAFIAGMISPDLKTETGLGVGRFIRSTEDPAVAEAAVTVVDDAQRKGLGRLLLMTLADAARERGVERFRADVLASNAPMLRMLEEVGAIVIAGGGSHDARSTLTFDVVLGEAGRDGGSGDGAHALARLLREAASSMAILIRRLAPVGSPD